MNFVISLFIGMIPEVIYFTLFLVYSKKLKYKKTKLFLLIFLSYFLCIFIKEHELFYYISFAFLIYLSLKILYKNNSQITDVFLIFVAYLYVCLISLIIYIPNNLVQYFICLIINRCLLFLPFIFKTKFNILYNKYCSLWNRNDKQKDPLKALL